MEEARLWDVLTLDCLDVDAWTALIEETERIAEVKLKLLPYHTVHCSPFCNLLYGCVIIFSSLSSFCAHMRYIFLWSYAIDLYLVDHKVMPIFVMHGWSLALLFLFSTFSFYISLSCRIPVYFLFDFMGLVPCSSFIIVLL